MSPSKKCWTHFRLYLLTPHSTLFLAKNDHIWLLLQSLRQGCSISRQLVNSDNGSSPPVWSLAASRSVRGWYLHGGCWKSPLRINGNGKVRNGGEKDEGRAITNPTKTANERAPIRVRYSIACLTLSHIQAVFIPLLFLCHIN